MHVSLTIFSRFRGDCRQYGLTNEFIDHLYILLGTTGNSNATDNLHTLQITAANTKCSPGFSVFNSRSLATTSNSGDSSASCAQVLPLQWISRNWTLSSSQPKSTSHCDWRSVSQSFSQSWCRAPSGAHDHIFITIWQLLMTRNLLLFDSYGLVIVGHPHSREDGSVFCESHCLH
jgi:hypothetical protein